MNLLKGRQEGCKQRQPTDYSKDDRRLTEKSIQGLDDKGMLSEILREVIVLEDIDDTTSEWVLLWTQRVEGKRKHNIM